MELGFLLRLRAEHLLAVLAEHRLPERDPSWLGSTGAQSAVPRPIDFGQTTGSGCRWQRMDDSSDGRERMGEEDEL